MVFSNRHCTGTVGKSAGTVVISNGHCAGTHPKCGILQRGLCKDTQKVRCLLTGAVEVHKPSMVIPDGDCASREMRIDARMRVRLR